MTALVFKAVLQCGSSEASGRTCERVSGSIRYPVSRFAFRNEVHELANAPTTSSSSYVNAGQQEAHADQEYQESDQDVAASRVEPIDPILHDAKPWQPRPRVRQRPRS